MEKTNFDMISRALLVAIVLYEVAAVLDGFLLVQVKEPIPQSAWHSDQQMWLKN